MKNTNLQIDDERRDTEGGPAGWFAFSIVAFVLLVLGLIILTIWFASTAV